MGEGTCAACADCDGGACTADDMGIRCPDCGGQVDSHAGHIGNGHVPACEKGRPPMREARYHCRHCDSTVIFPKKWEPEGVSHD